MSNIITTIHRPVLTAEERARRMEEIKGAAVRLFIAREKARKERNS